MFHILFEKVNSFYEKIFSCYGRFLSKNYINVIVASFLINLLLSIGIYRIKVITDAEDLFMPIDSEAIKDELYLKTIFNDSTITSNFYVHQLLDMGTWAEINFIPCATNKKQNHFENILQSKYMEEIVRINDHLLQNTFVQINDSFKLGFEHVCAKRNGKCTIEGRDLLGKDFYEEWIRKSMYEKTRIQKEKQENQLLGISDISGSNHSDEPSSKGSNEFRFYFKITGLDPDFTDLTYNLGKHFYVNSFNQSSNGSVPGFSRFLKLRYNLKSSPQFSDKYVKLWEVEFLKNINNLLVNFSTSSKEQCKFDNKQNDKAILNLLRISYATSQSLDTEIVANITLDTFLVTGTFTLMTIFSILLMSINTNWVTSPGALLPSAGIMSAVFGLTSAFGLLSYIGYDGCNLIFVIPFLVIGIGIDDMFIIYASYTHYRKNQIKNKNRKDEDDLLSDLISNSLRKSGVSITITSLTDFVAFIVGLTTGFKGVQIFCVYASFSILFCYLNQLTLFSGFLCLHTIRMRKKNNAFLFCFKQKSFKCCNDDSSRDEEEPEGNEGIELNSNLNTNTNGNNDNIKKQTSVTKTEKYKWKFGKCLQKKVAKGIRQIWANLFKFIIYNKIGKTLTIIIYFVYMGLSIWSASLMKEGISLGDLVSDDSYYNTYIKDNTELVDLNPIVMFVVYKPIDYDNSQTRLKLKTFVNDAFKIDGINKKFQLNWLDNYSNNEKIKYKKKIENLYNDLKDFPPFLNDLVINKIENNRTSVYLLDKEPKKSRNANDSNVEYQIAASRFFMQYDRLYFSSLDAKPMHLLRKLCRESELPILAYSVPFKYYEQFEQTLPNVVQSFIIAIESMYFIALIFIPDLISVLCILFSMISIMMGLIGLMNFWSLTLSSITMIELIMSVGFCVDFSAHITHAFIASVGKGDRNHRAYKACMHIGLPIFNSAFSTIIGIFLLGFCKSYIFMTFFKTMVILMTLGVINSLFFLPVLLSLIGPYWPRHKNVETKIKKANQNDSTIDENIKLTNIDDKTQLEQNIKSELNNNNNLNVIEKVNDL